MTTAKPQQDPQRVPGVEIGDHVYFQGDDGPHAGCVRAHGRHGCTIECDGEDRRVPWDKVLGHKKRAAQRYSIIDEGEDGMIVEDAAGQRRYLSIPPDADEDKMVTKSLGADGRVLLFFKTDAHGGPMASRPGLTKKQIVDRTGRKQTKWVRTNKDVPGERKSGAPNEAPAQHLSSVKSKPPENANRPRPGDTVHFQAGDFEGTGQIVGEPGVDGAHVKDSQGRVHQVRYSEMNDGPGDDGDDGGENKPVQSADEIARALFNTSELDKLPAKAAQPVHSWKELKAKAPEALEQFKSMLDKVAGDLDLETGRRPESLDLAQRKENEKAEQEGREPAKLSEDDYMLPEHWDNDRGFLFMGPLKGEKRAREKVQADYKGDWSQVRDMVRATIAVPMVTQLPMVLRTLEANGMKLAQKPKNNLVKPLPGGYRDINLIVKVPNGLLAELQLHVKPMTVAKERGHKPYEVSRSIEAKYKDKGLEDDKSKWSQEDREAHSKAMAEQEKIYGDAWEKATKQVDEPESNLSKSLNSSIILLWK